MNTAQRKFLIERIQYKVREKIKELKEEMVEYPSASNYIFKAIMEGKLELQPHEVIIKALKQMALDAKEGKNWLSDKSMGWEKERTVCLEIDELIIVPSDYDEERKRVKAHNDKIEAEIDLLKTQLDTIEVRVQLASDKTLQNLINQVDDMGDLSLVDTKLKLLN